MSKKTMKRLSVALVFVMLVSLMTGASAAGLEAFTKSNTYTAGQFTDVKSSDWFATSVATAYEYGLVKGASATAFNPQGNLTVAETIVLACRLHHIYSGGDGKFVQGNPWYQVYVDYALANGLIRSGEFANYTAPATRAQVASVFARVFPQSELGAINYIGTIPDVPLTAEYYSSVHLLYTAGVLTGSDSKGSFRPNTTIRRSEIAAIVTRMVDVSQRKSVAFETGITLATIGDYTLDRDMFEYLVQNVAYLYESEGIPISTMLDIEVTNGITGAEYLKQQALDYAKQNAAIITLAKMHGITITAEDKLALQAQKEVMIGQMGGLQAYQKSLKEAGITESAVNAYNELMYLAEKIRVALFTGDGIYAPKEADIKKVLNDNYYRIKHILILADPSDKEFAEKKALANSILTRAKRGEDFDSLIAKYGEDPGMQMSDGYVIDQNGAMYDGTGTMVSEFTNASVALKTGQVSDLVQSAYGFHIIKRYPFDSAYFAAHLSEFIGQLSTSALQSKLSEIMSGLAVHEGAELANFDISSLFHK